MKLTKGQLNLFKLFLCKDLRRFYNPNLVVKTLDEMDDFCTIIGVDEATIEEQAENRTKTINYPSDAKSYIIRIRVIDQSDHYKGRLMKYFVTFMRFDPYPVPETIFDMRLINDMAYKLEK